MSMHQYRYAIEIYRGESELIDQAPASVDWEPALEWVWMQGLRKGQLQLTDGTSSSLIRPLWHPELGEPYLSGFRVTILAEHAAGVSEDFSTDYFKGEANAVTRSLLDEGRLGGQDNVKFLALAFFNPEHAGAGPALKFKSTEVAPELPIAESSLADFTAGATRVEEGNGTNDGADDIPVLIPRRILDETRDAARQRRDRETGGMLIGNLRRDVGCAGNIGYVDPVVYDDNDGRAGNAGHNDLFVEVTAQIPVTHAPAEVNKLTFTPETWTAAQVAIDARGRGEIFLGWWHSHPVHEWCRDCPPEKKSRCALALGFLSPDDKQLHRTVFPRAYTCALVVSDINEREDIVQTLFGWRRGAIERRGYYLVGDTAPDAADDVTHGAASATEHTDPSAGTKSNS